MNRHDADTVGAFLEYRRLRGSGTLRLVGEPLHEATEREATSHVEAAPELAHALNVGEHLIAGGAHGESGMRACGR